MLVPVLLHLSKPLTSNTFQGAQLYIQVLDLDSPMPLSFDVIMRYRFDLSVSVGLTTTRSSSLSGATRTSITVSATVLCAPFYFGSSCQFFEHCEFNAVTCSDRGTCVNGFTNFTCNCNPPYIGANCEGQNFCVGRNCTGRGTCTDSYTCVCNAGYTGADCEVDIDECLLMERVCSGHGNCSHGIATFTCSCDPGYTGTICETNIDDCVNRNCSGNGVCVDGVDSFSCECVSGFTGEMCNTAGIVILLFCNYTSCRVGWWSRGSHSDRRSGGRSPSADADTPAPVSGDGGGVCTEESSGEDHSRHSVAR